MALKLTHPLLVATLGLLLASPAAPIAAQEGKLMGYVMSERGEIRPIRKLDKSEIPFYSVVWAFYDDILIAYRWGDVELNQRWKALGVKPDTPEANSILKATFRAQALFLDFPKLPLGASDQEFLEAQYKGQQREARELQEITLSMLRELRGAGISLDLWEVHLEQKIRSGTSMTHVGEKNEYNRKFERLQQGFEAAIKAELDASDEEIL